MTYVHDDMHSASTRVNVYLFDIWVLGIAMFNEDMTPQWRRYDSWAWALIALALTYVYVM